MKSYTDSLLSARAALIAEIDKLTAPLRQRVSQIDALLAGNDVDISSLPASGGDAPKKRRGRRPGSAKKAATAETAPAKGGRKKGDKAKRNGRQKRADGFNATGAVRAIVADMDKPFTVADLREEFEKRHPGVLATLNRIVLSLALQSMGRRGEVTSKKDPKGKGNIFTKTGKLKV